MLVPSRLNEYPAGITIPTTARAAAEGFHLWIIRGRADSLELGAEHEEDFLSDVLEIPQQLNPNSRR